MLGYATRKAVNLFPEAAATYPTMGDANSTYMSHDDKVVARHHIIDQVAAARTLAQHEKSGPFFEEFVSDRKKMWDILCCFVGSD